MIQLRTDCLVFETAHGRIPCSAELVVTELIGEVSGLLDPEILHHAAAGVLRYFRDDLGRESVTVEEFTRALVRVLRSFGLQVTTDEPASAEAVLAANLDLQDLALESGPSFELAFFNHLRREVHLRLELAPRVLRLHGLRGCVKHLAAARRWCPRCRRLSDQILSFLGECLLETAPGGNCALVVS
jgi:hypothetical protein